MTISADGVGHLLHLGDSIEGRWWSGTLECTGSSIVVVAVTNSEGGSRCLAISGWGERVVAGTGCCADLISTRRSNRHSITPTIGHTNSTTRSTGGAGEASTGEVNGGIVALNTPCGIEGNGWIFVVHVDIVSWVVGYDTISSVIGRSSPAEEVVAGSGRGSVRNSKCRIVIISNAFCLGMGTCVSGHGTAI